MKNGMIVLLFIFLLFMVLILTRCMQPVLPGRIHLLTESYIMPIFAVLEIPDAALLTVFEDFVFLMLMGYTCYKEGVL